MDRSAPRRRTPARLHVRAVDDDDGNGWITATVDEHSLARVAVVLRVVTRIRRSDRIVVRDRALAVRAARGDVELDLCPRRYVLHVEASCHAARLRTDAAW